MTPAASRSAPAISVEIDLSRGRWKGVGMVVDTVRRPGEVFVPFHYGHGTKRPTSTPGTRAIQSATSLSSSRRPFAVRRLSFGQPQPWLLDRMAELTGESLEPFAARRVRGTVNHLVSNGTRASKLRHSGTSVLTAPDSPPSRLSGSRNCPPHPPGREAWIQRHASINEQGRPGYIIRGVRGQPNGGLRDVARFPDPLVGHQRHQVGIGRRRVPGAVLIGVRIAPGAMLFTRMNAARIPGRCSSSAASCHPWTPRSWRARPRGSPGAPSSCR